MLFGRKKEEPPERVPVGELVPLLNGLFNSSLPDFTARSERILAKISDDWKLFSRACESFSADRTQPDLEDLPHVTESNVVLLKGNYVKALDEITAKGRAGLDCPTSYEAYKARLDDNAYRINQVLQVNHRFRPVIIAYAKGLDRFKRAFSELERHIGELRTVIEGHSGQFNAYRENARQIDELRMYIDSAGELKGALESKPGGGSKADATADIEGLAEANRGRLLKTEARITDLNGRIAGFLNPLERAAKKYDHVKQQREKLCDYLANPDLIRAQYQRFAGMLDSLSEAVGDGSLQLKNPGELRDRIAELKQAGIDTMIGELDSLEKERRAFDGIARDYDMRLGEQKSLRGEADAAKRRLENAAQQLAETESKKRELKGSLESLFLRAYGKRIEIIL
jgi:chromosome segregation ATPase